ncbi:hypothetical protein B0T20DRAFT_368554 [Sordaria brevicollis]|uniref:3'-5' exonuclease domain-containing protein n=1 Tax=Sordaria brevicollis TaxID=83679 RepID=A0AAE0PQK8_SORBR|nr:hypothetical protein B0T20DRAFT_368554 [Sordaria brevicollis]
MRSPHPTIPQALGAGANAVNNLSTTSLSLRQSRRRFFASSPSSSIACSSRFPVHFGAMEKKDQTWNSSRGITFAGDSSRRVEVVRYPQLPSLARYHSDSGVSTASTNPEPVLPLNPTVPQGNPAGTGTTLDSQGQEFVDAKEVLEEQIEVILEDENAESNDEDAAFKPPYTPLSFKMSEELFKEAKMAKEGTSKSYWTYNLYRGPDKDGKMEEKVKVHYCRSAMTTERVLKQYFMNEKLLGLDLEWEPNAMPKHGPRNNVSVIQIASESRVGIFHISLYPKKDELASPLLKQIIEDPEVYKTGVWIGGDCTRLKNYLEIEAKGQFELSHLYKLVKYSASGEHKLVDRRLVPLATIVKDTLKLPMFKGQVRTSAWSKTLNMDQILYSASDAYAGVQIFAMLDHQRKQLKPTPPLPYAAELKKPIRLAVDDLEEAGLLDEPPFPDETTDNAALSADSLAAAGDNINLEIEGDGSITLSGEDTSTTTKTTGTKKSTSTSTATKRKRTPATTTPKDSSSTATPLDPLVTEATLWAQNYILSRTSLTTSSTTKKTINPLNVPNLRAYYLWSRNPSLNVEALAALLQIKITTAATYILQAVKAEQGKLSFEPKRMREEVFGCGAAMVKKEIELERGRWYAVKMLCEVFERAERELEEKGGKVGEKGMEGVEGGFGQDEGVESGGAEAEESEGELKVEEGKKEVKQETAEDVVKAALEELDLEEDWPLEDSQPGSSQETVDVEEAERLRKMSRSH